MIEFISLSHKDFFSFGTQNLPRNIIGVPIKEGSEAIKPGTNKKTKHDSTKPKKQTNKKIEKK